MPITFSLLEIPSGEVVGIFSLAYSHVTAVGRPSKKFFNKYGGRINYCPDVIEAVSNYEARRCIHLVLFLLLELSRSPRCLPLRSLSGSPLSSRSGSSIIKTFKMTTPMAKETVVQRLQHQEDLVQRIMKTARNRRAFDRSTIPRRNQIHAEFWVSGYQSGHMSRERRTLWSWLLLKIPYSASCWILCYRQAALFRRVY